MKKELLFILAMMLGISAFFIGGCSSSPTQSTSGEKEIRLGVVPLPHYADAWVAMKKGFLQEELKKEGYRLNWQTIALGPVVSEAFAAGEIDMGVMGDFPAFIGRSAGTDFRIVSTASTAPQALALVVRSDSSVQSMADLKGKKIATTKAAYGQKLLALLMDKAGMKREDISFVSMSMADLPLALARGDIDAGVVWDPILTKLEASGEIKVVADGTGIYEAYALWMATEQTVKEHPQAIQAVTRARARGAAYIKEHPEEATKLLLEEIRIPEDQVVKMVAKFNYDPAMPAAFVTDMKETEEFMYQNGLLKRHVDVEKFIRQLDAI